MLFGLYGLGYLDQNDWKRNIILITREPNEPNQPSISEQCNLAINYDSEESLLKKIEEISAVKGRGTQMTSSITFW